MNRRLFVLGGAMLCAVITYASVLAVKNRAARKSVAPNTTQQETAKVPKNGEVIAVSTDPASGSPIVQQAVGPVNNNVPEHVVYSFLFRHQNFLKKKAEEAETQGKDSAFFRKYYQREAKLDDRQATVLSEIATQCELDVKAIEAEAKLVVERLRAERATAPKKPNEAPKPSPELRVLQQRRNNVVLQARNQLEKAMGPSSFTEFQKYVREKVASQIKPKSPDALRSLERDSTERQPRGKPPQQ